MIDVARALLVPRPWGKTNLHPWHARVSNSSPIGEISFELPEGSRAQPTLLLKLLFTSQPLSIQVHPDDDQARALGLANGKTEAWYVLKAEPHAQIALGLTKTTTRDSLKAAARDGTVLDLVSWRTVFNGDIIAVPAGTIHAIGAGIVIAEIQQRSDTTFRLYDFGRNRELHIEEAIAAGNPGPSAAQVAPLAIAKERTLLVANPHFVFERIRLPGNSAWLLNAERETWILAIAGCGAVASIPAAAGTAFFADKDGVTIETAENGIDCLVAYAGANGPIADLLRRTPSSSLARSPVSHATRPST